MTPDSPLLGGLFTDALPSWSDPDGAPGSGDLVSGDRVTGDLVLGDLVSGDLGRTIENHRRLLGSAIGDLVDTLRVPDVALAAVGRTNRDAPGPADELRVTAVTSGGAGGLVSLARRSVHGVRVVAVESTLRDLDDLGQNADRVVAAAHELDESVVVFVGLPARSQTARSQLARPIGPATGWVRAAETVEAAGLQARLTAGGQNARALVEQLGVLIELDLPFAVDLGSGPTWRTPHPWSLLAAVASLIEDAGTDEAASLLAGDRDRAAGLVAGLDRAEQIRTRRRLRRIDGVRAADLAEMVPRTGAGA